MIKLYIALKDPDTDQVLADKEMLFDDKERKDFIKELENTYVMAMVNKYRELDK